MSQSAYVMTFFGNEVNLISLMIFSLIVGLITLFIRIQLTKKLEFADMLTKDGRTVSLTKVLQLVGGATATWVIIKTTLMGSISMELFLVYLAYVASIEGFSKFISAKYQYNEKSIRDAKKDEADEEIK
jgi:hypothetical protein